MKQLIKTIGNMMADSYFLIIMLILPLYFTVNYNTIGEDKYILYKNVSIPFFLCWLVLYFMLKIHGFIVDKELKLPHFCPTDYFILSYAVSVIFSYLFSNYKSTALLGYSGWNMGLITQLLFVWSYFFISRHKINFSKIFPLITFFSSMVFLLAVINRMGFDPLNLLPYEPTLWETQNLVSTIGNINWYCGYCSVFLPFSLYYFYTGNKISIRIFSAICTFAGIASVLLQGSDTGYLILFSMFVILFMISLKGTKSFFRFLEVLIIVPILCIALSYIPITFNFPLESNTQKIISSPYWIYLFFIIIFIYGKICYLYHRKQTDLFSNQKVYRFFLKAIPILLLSFFILFIIIQLSESLWQFLGKPAILKMTDEWGSFRGAVWKQAWIAFCESNLITKIFGVGSDCFAPYFYDRYTLDIEVIGRWKNDIYANVHNEWFNTLFTHGICGLVSYGGFFLTSWYQFWKKSKEEPLFILCLMSITAYCINGILSFQQITSTPFIFLLIAVFINKTTSSSIPITEKVC